MHRKFRLKKLYIDISITTVSFWITRRVSTTYHVLLKTGIKGNDVLLTNVLKRNDGVDEICNQIFEVFNDLYEEFIKYAFWAKKVNNVEMESRLKSSFHDANSLLRFFLFLSKNRFKNRMILPTSV